MGDIVLAVGPDAKDSPVADRERLKSQLRENHLQLNILEETIKTDSDCTRPTVDLI